MSAVKAVPQTIIALCERIDIAAFVDVYIKYLRTQCVKMPKVRIINLQELENLPQYLENLEQFAVPANISKADDGAQHRVSPFAQYARRGFFTARRKKDYSLLFII